MTCDDDRFFLFEEGGGYLKLMSLWQETPRSYRTIMNFMAGRMDTVIPCQSNGAGHKQEKVDNV